MGAPPLCGGGRPSGLGLQPRAASALCRGSGGSGRHRALARPPVLPGAGHTTITVFVFSPSVAQTRTEDKGRGQVRISRREMLYNISSPVPQPPGVRGDFAPLWGGVLCLLSFAAERK